MRTKVISLICVFMVVVAIKTNAQVTGTNPIPKSAAIKSESTRVNDPYSTSGSASQYRSLELSGIEGQKYIGTDWPKGTVVLRDGGVIDNYKLRYDILADQMQFVTNKDTLAFAAPHELNTISFGGRTFIYENYKCENSVRQGYFELVVPGKNRLLLKRMVTYQMPDETNPSDEAKTKYFIDECYFISKPGEPSNKVLCNRKSAMSVLQDHNAEIEEYMRVTGNKVRNGEDLAKLVEYYNSLEEEK